MRIRELIIEGFGQFYQRSLGPFDAPIVVLFGPNESGKSTLLNFIRTTLFGFPTRDRKQHYPPLSGGNHGGRIIVEDDDSVEYVVERYVGARGGPVSIRGVTGDTYPSAKLGQLLGSATKDVFENVFAFSLDELQTSDLLKDENVNSQIYSAGVGTTNLPDLRRKMTADMDNIYKPGGSRPIANSLASELGDVEQNITNLTRNSDQYSALMDSVEKADKQISESVQLKKELQDKRIKLSAMKDAWEDWIAFLDVELRLRELPMHKGLPPNPVEELEKRENALSSDSIEFNDAQEQLEAAESYSSAIQPNELILEDETLIVDINQRKTSVFNAVRDLPDLEAERVSLTTKVENRLSNLGTGWNRRRLETTDLESLPVTIDIDKHRASISGQSQKVHTQESSLTTLRSALAQEKTTHTQLRDPLSEVTEYSQGELDNMKKVASDTETLIGEYKIANRAHRRLQNLSGTDELSGDRLNRFLIPGMLAAAVIITIVGTIIGQNPVFTYGVGGLLLIVGSLSYLLSRINSRSRSSLSGTASELGESEQELKKIKGQLVDSIGAMGLDKERIDQPDSVRKEVDSIQAQINVWTRLNDMVRESEKQIEKQSSLVKDSEILLQKETTKLGEAESRWKKWLSDKKLPSPLTPEAMGTYCGHIAAGREEFEAENRMSIRVGEIKSHIDQYSAFVKPLGEKHGEDFDSNDVNSLVKAADNLFRRCEDAKGQKIQKEQLLADVSKYEKSRERRRDEFDASKGNFDLLLEQAEAADSDVFREKAKDQAKREDLSIQKQKLVNALQIRSGPGGEFKAFRTALTSRNISEIELDLIQVQEKLDDEEKLHSCLVEAKAKDEFQIGQLVNEDELSTLQVQRSQLLEQLSVHARTWARLKLADEMVGKGIDKFQRERQPGVIKHAREFFADVTNNRYSTLYAPPGEHTIVVKEESGSQKQPGQLSRGTREQLYLSLRFGLIREYGEHSEALPVIVDEVLVNFDPNRAQRASVAFAELSKTNQILVFTCHPKMVDGFRSVCSETQVINVG